MCNLIRPVGRLFLAVFLGLILTDAALAFECTNAGAGTTAPNDGGEQSGTACGNAATVSVENGTAIGGSAEASGDGSTALGGLATASAGGSSALGFSATASGGTGSTAVGIISTASGISSTAVGGDAEASGNESIAVGVFATAGGDFSTALGYRSKILSPHSNATALGFQAQVEQSNAMVLGSIPGVNNLFRENEYVDVGIGTTMPQAALHVERANGAARVLVMETQLGPSMPFQGVAQGLVRFELNDEAAGERWRFTNAGDKFAINNVGADSPGTEMSVFKNGDLVIGGLLTENSDVNAKQDIVPVVAQDVLAKIAKLQIAEWSYKDAAEQRHIGPMAQDFHAAFGLGRDNKHIATLDTSGVALAGIQALAAENHRIAKENRRIAEENQLLRNRLENLENVVRDLVEPQRQAAEIRSVMN